MLIRGFTHLLMSSIWKRFVLVGLVLGVICSTFAFPIPTDAYSRQSYECHDGSDDGMIRFKSDSECAYIQSTYGCGDHDDRPGYRESDPMVDNDPIDKFLFCYSPPPPKGSGGTECRNYDMGAPYWHDIRVFLRVLEVPISDEIRVRYRACWNDNMVWQDGGPMQVVRASGSPVYKPSTKTVGARFGNGSHPLVLDSGVTLLYEPRLNATFQGSSINADVTVTAEITVRKGGCARLYLNNNPVRHQHC